MSDRLRNLENVQLQPGHGSAAVETRQATGDLVGRQAGQTPVAECIHLNW